MQVRLVDVQRSAEHVQCGELGVAEYTEPLKVGEPVVEGIGRLRKLRIGHAPIVAALTGERGCGDLTAVFERLPERGVCVFELENARDPRDVDTLGDEHGDASDAA